MSLHALATNMASKGRNGDSMLVHMTPGEVHGLQALAMKHGGTLTTNPDTGLPEANFLKSLLPVLAGFALNAFVPGLGAAVGGAFGASAAVGTGIAVGGLTGLATGSLSKGLMAGLGAYGGAGLQAGLAGAGADALTREALSVEGALPSLENITQVTGEGYGGSAANYSDQVNSAVKAARDTASGMPTSDLLSAGAKAAGADPMGFARQNMMPLAAAAAPIMAGMMVPTTTKSAPIQSPGRIVEKRWNGREFVPVASTDASVFNTSGRTFSDPYRGYNNGGIVALAGGGDVKHFAIGDLVKADIDAAYAAGDYARVNELAQANQITAADVADTYKGFDASGLAGLGINLYTPDTGGGGAPVDYFANQFAPDVFAPVVTGGGGGGASVVTAPVVTAPVTDTSGGLAALNTTAGGDGTGDKTPKYTQYSDEAFRAHLAKYPNADLAKDLITYNADPAAFNRYIASLTSPFVGSTDTKGGSGTFGIYNEFNRLGVSPDEYYAAALANDPKYGGWDKGMIQKAYNLDKGAYALTDQIAKDKIAADPKLGYDKQWVKYMDDNKYTVDDMAQAFGISKNEIAARVKKVRDAEAVVTPPVVKPPVVPPVVTPPVVVPPINATQNTITGVGVPTDLYTAPAPSLPVGVSGNTGPSQIGGGATINPNGTVTTSPRIPGIPVGGFTGSQNLRDTYIKGGGSLGYTSPKFDKIEDFNAKYVDKRLTGDSKAAYDFLTGKAGATYPTKSGVGQISEDYATAVLGYPARGNLPYIYNKKTGKMDANPDYVAPGRDAAGNVTYSMSLNDIKSSLKDTPMSGQALYDWAMTNNLSAQQIADATGRSLSSVYSDFRAGSKAAAKKKEDDKAAGINTLIDNSGAGSSDSGGGPGGTGPGGVGGAGGPGSTTAANPADMGAVATPAGDDGDDLAGGGMAGYAMGYALGGLGTLGGYSDGGRLLKGPGDGVSDSIPATIGRKQQPARLADGEFVVPARIVSELGNGSTDAGAKKLYAMLDRVQRARGKTTGKNKVAANSRADKYLPA